MSSELLQRAAVAIEADYEPRANHGDPHAMFHMAVAAWLNAEAAAMDSISKFNAVTAPLVREEKYSIRGAAMTVSMGENGSLGIKADTSEPAVRVARAYLNEAL